MFICGAFAFSLEMGFIPAETVGYSLNSSNGQIIHGVPVDNLSCPSVSDHLLYSLLMQTLSSFQQVCQIIDFNCFVLELNVKLY